MQDAINTAHFIIYELVIADKMEIPHFQDPCSHSFVKCMRTTFFNMHSSRGRKRSQWLIVYAARLSPLIL
jgi:hypothetical protein